MKNFIFLFVLAIGFTSCKSIYAYLSGIHSPKVQTEVKLKNYLTKKEINPEYAIFFKDHESMMNVYYRGGKFSVPEIIVFDSKGRFIPYKEEKTCNASAYAFTDNLCKLNPKNYNSEKDSLSGFLKNFNVIPHVRPDGYTVIITWAEYAGVLNKNHVKVWVESLEKQPCKPQIYLACADMLEPWASKD